MIRVLKDRRRQNKTRNRWLHPASYDRKSPIGRARSISVLGNEFPTISDAMIFHVEWLKSRPRWRNKSFAQILKCLSWRICAGWSGDQAFEYERVPEWARKAEPHKVECAGVAYPSISAFAKAFGLNKKIVFQQFAREKWPAEAIAGLITPPHYRERFGTLTGHIYKCVHVKTCRAYVGLSIDASRRQWQHMMLARKGGTKQGTLQHAIYIFGAHQFEFSIIEEAVPAHDLAARERYWIKALGTLWPKGFNQNAGGVLGANSTPVICDGVTYFSIAHLAQSFGMTERLIRDRRKRGWSYEEIVGVSRRKPRTRTEIAIDLGDNQLTIFKSAAAACHALYLPRGQLARLRGRTGQEWQDLIYDTFMANVRRTEAEAPQLLSPYPRQTRS